MPRNYFSSFWTNWEFWKVSPILWDFLEFFFKIGYMYIQIPIFSWVTVLFPRALSFFLSILLYLQNKVIATNITNTPPGFQVYLMNGRNGELFSIFTSRGWSGFTSFPSSPPPGDIYNLWPPWLPVLNIFGNFLLTLSFFPKTNTTTPITLTNPTTPIT